MRVACSMSLQCAVQVEITIDALRCPSLAFGALLCIALKRHQRATIANHLCIEQSNLSTARPTDTRHRSQQCAPTGLISDNWRRSEEWLDCLDALFCTHSRRSLFERLHSCSDQFKAGANNIAHYCPLCGSLSQSARDCCLNRKSKISAR